ncbi:MAG TPA: hypothetical protein VLM89_15610 [Phycisphaerae bacterium]|nr:hypothetical protein [Phycisphaerae bacterium]
MFSGQYKLTGHVVIEEAQPSAPEVKKLLEYSREAMLNLPPGQVVELAFDIDKPEEWKLERTSYMKEPLKEAADASAPKPVVGERGR